MRFIPFALCLFFHVFAHADWAAVESTAFPLQDPPVAGSKAEKADFIQLHQYQDNRTQETCDFAALQRIPTFTALFGNASGLTNSQDIQCLNPLFTKIFKLTERVTGYYKRKYTRLRPYDEDATLSPCVEKTGGRQAYPSSHAAFGYIGGCILKELFPEQAAEFSEYGDYIGELRIIIGVHHPSDAVAGRTLGDEICTYLLSDSEFKQDLRNTSEMCGIN